MPGGCPPPQKSRRLRTEVYHQLVELRKMKGSLEAAPKGGRCMKPPSLAIFLGVALPVALLTQHEGHEPPSSGLEEGLGRAHMQTSCSPAVSVDFDRALALLHNFGTPAPSNASIRSQRMIRHVRWPIGVRR